MEVSRIRALRGPNLWSRHTAIQAIVTCEGAECAIADLPGFEARLRDRFPELGDLIPADGEVIEGVASVNESAITGESAPVIREAGGDRSAVTAGTRVISDGAPRRSGGPQ